MADIVDTLLSTIDIARCAVYTISSKIANQLNCQPEIALTAYTVCANTKIPQYVNIVQDYSLFLGRSKLSDLVRRVAVC